MGNSIGNYRLTRVLALAVCLSGAACTKIDSASRLVNPSATPVNSSPAAIPKNPPVALAESTALDTAFSESNYDQLVESILKSGTNPEKMLMLSTLKRNKDIEVMTGQDARKMLYGKTLRQANNEYIDQVNASRFRQSQQTEIVKRDAASIERN